MTCNLAVSLAKAAVTDEYLQTLLTPAIVQPIVLAYLQQQYPHDQPNVIEATEHGVSFRVGSCTIVLKRGKIEVTDAQRVSRRAAQLIQELEHVLTNLADRLFQQHVQHILQQTLGTAFTEVTTVEVENEGHVQQAAVFTLTL
jgi:hypothetical protein